jgi:hypothetical protein
VNSKGEEVKVFAISRLLVGESYRSVQTAIQENFGGASVSLGILSAWAHEDPSQAQAISQAHLRAIGHQRIRIAHKAGDLLEQRLDDGTISPAQIPVTFGIASDKLDSMLKIVQDERKTSPNVELIREQLRGKPAHELKALADAMPDTSPAPSVDRTPEIRRYHALDGDLPGN